MKKRKKQRGKGRDGERQEEIGGETGRRGERDLCFVYSLASYY